MISNSPKRLFVLEFNELSPSLVARFMGEGMLPNFQRFYETSTIYTTNAGEEPPYLEPWIQWPTIHSGLPYREHKAFHLGDGRTIAQPCLAKLLSDAGIRVGVFGSMNTNYGPLNGYYLPDPWDAGATPSPAWLAPFFDTVARQVQESSKNEGLSKRELLRFGWFMVRHGLRPKTVVAALRQLWQERIDPGLAWRRSTILERMQYDLFRHLNRRFAVQFATLFCNSTAHFQHYYWRNMQPELFVVPPLAADHASLSNAIQYGYQCMDALLGQVQRDYPDVTLVLCTALSQQPWQDTTKCTFRPHRFEDLLQFAGIAPGAVRIQPVMAEEFHISCNDDSAAKEALARLQALQVAGTPLMRLQRDGANLFAACAINDVGTADKPIKRTVDGRQVPFTDLFYRVHTMRSGRHHPDGILWVRNGQHRVHNTKISLTSIAPLVLNYFGVALPPYMNSDGPLVAERSTAAAQLVCSASNS